MLSTQKNILDENALMLDNIISNVLSSSKKKKKKKKKIKMELVIMLEIGC